jgi:WD40 repeat protein
MVHTANRNIQGEFSPDGQTLVVVAGKGIVRQWDIATGRERATLPGQWGSYYAVFSSDGRFLAAACDDDVVRVWDLARAFAAATPEKPGT